MQGLKKSDVKSEALLDAGRDIIISVFGDPDNNPSCRFVKTDLELCGTKEKVPEWLEANGKDGEEHAAEQGFRTAISFHRAGSKSS